MRAPPLLGLATFALVAALAVSVPAQAQTNVEPFTIVVIPDTQIYVQTDAGTQVFRDQFEWVVQQQVERNIIFVTHEGDVSQDPSSTTEWDRIEQVYAVLDAAGMPHGIAPGNHDINSDGTAPEYDARFGVDRYDDKNWFGGHHVAEGNRSSFQMLAAGGHQLLFLHLRHLEPQFGDVDAVLDWAGAVLAAHPDHLVFITTHEFTNGDGTVRLPALQSVVQDHCNVAAVFSGHRTSGAATGSFDDGCDRTVHHVLTNYQQIEGGGQGFLRTVSVDPLTLAAELRVYSPTLDQERSGPAESFDVAIAPLVAVPGDANCDRRLDIGDALVIAQFSVGTRSSRQACPLVDPTTELNVADADLNNDGQIDIGDALLVARCSVGLVNPFCPG